MGKCKMRRKHETSIITTKQALVALIVTIVLILCSLFFAPRTQSVKAPASALSSVAIYRDFLAGNPVSRELFAETFENGFNLPDVGKIERIAEKLGVSTQDVLKSLERTKQAVIFVGFKDDVPEKLRSITQPAEAPATQQSDVPE